DFSMPVCRYPRSGIAFRTVSPSSSNKMRSTPCVDGCCGPMLRTIVFVGPVAVSTVSCPNGVVPIALMADSSYIASRSPEYRGSPQQGNPCATDGLPNRQEAKCAANQDAP